jgi:hypothetical protein
MAQSVRCTVTTTELSNWSGRVTRRKFVNLKCNLTKKNGSMMSGIQHLVSRDLTGSLAVSDH